MMTQAQSLKPLHRFKPWLDINALALKKHLNHFSRRGAEAQSLKTFTLL